MNELYEPLLERELDAIPAAVRAYRASHSLEELWLEVTRFALLAYAPSEHSRHALLCCLAVHDIGLSDEWLIACAGYAAEARQPWSEPPIFDPPAVQGDPGSLRDALHDRHAAERWLAFHVDDAPEEMRAVAREHGDALLVVNAAIRLVPLLGEKGKYATLRVGVWDLVARSDEPRMELAPFEELVRRCVEENGSLESTHALLVAAARSTSRFAERTGRIACPPYRLPRDYGQFLLAHAAGLPDEVLEAVRHNLEHGENYDEWTLA